MSTLWELNCSLFLLNFITKCRNNIPKCNFFFSNEYKHPNRFVGMFLCINLLFVSCQLFLIKERKYLNFKTLPVSKHMVLMHPKNVIFHYSSIATINYHEMLYVYQRRYYKFVRKHTSPDSWLTHNNILWVLWRMIWQVWISYRTSKK